MFNECLNKQKTNSFYFMQKFNNRKVSNIVVKWSETTVFFFKIWGFFIYIGWSNNVQSWVMVLVRPFMHELLIQKIIPSQSSQCPL